MRRARIDLSHRPFIVIWEATRACALACRHCRAESVPNRDPRELDTQQAFALMDEIKAFGSPPPFFVITGGDPFLRPDLFELVSYGKRIGLPVAVSPSGTDTLDRANLTALHEAGAHAISLSLDGAAASTHDDFRGVPGTFARTVRAWEIAREVGLKVQINTTVTPGNVAELPDVLVMIDELGAMTWSVFFLVPTGRGSALSQLTPRQAEDVLHFCYDADHVVSVKTTEAPSFRRVVIQRSILERHGLDPVATLGLGDDYRRLSGRLAELGLAAPQARLRRPPLPINAARGFVFISHVGEVFPSGFLPVAVGDVHDQPLGGLYRESDLFRQLRDSSSRVGRCGECEFRAVCGGSRPRAYGATGDVLADDPLCAYEPGTFGFADEVRAELAGAPA